MGLDQHALSENRTTVWIRTLGLNRCPENRDRSRASGKRCATNLASPTHSDAWHKELLCNFQASALRHCPSSHFLLQRIFCPASHVLLSAAASNWRCPVATRSPQMPRPPRSARHQKTRCRSKCAALLAPRVAVKKDPCDGASGPSRTGGSGAIHASTFAALLPVRLGPRSVMNPAKAHRRYVVFSGAPQSRKGTSEKSH